MRPIANLEEVIGSLDRLASLPDSVVRVLDELQSPDADASSISRTIARDPPLTAALLRLANSVVYLGSKPVASVQQAVVRLGAVEVRNLVTATAVLEVFGKKRDRHLLLDLYNHAVASACIMEVLSKRARKGVLTPWVEHLFVTGLLHDVGLFALDQVVEGSVAQALNLAGHLGVTLAEAELELFGFTHAHVGAALLERWQLPEAVVSAALWHHQMAQAPAEHAPLVCATAVCDSLVQRLRCVEALDPLVDRCSLDGYEALGIKLEEIPMLLERAHEAATAAAILTRTVVSRAA